MTSATKIVSFALPDELHMTLNPGRHYDYGEFFPPCMKFMTPQEYVGVMFSKTNVKTEVTCEKCNEWIHA